MTQTMDTAEIVATASAAGTEPAPGLQPAELGNVLMTRVNSLVGRRLASPTFRTAIRSLVAAEADCASLKESACDELYALGGELGSRDRGAILKLRRSIFNNRAVDALPAGTESLPAVTAWHAAHQRAELARAALEHGHAAFLEQERRVLAEMLGNESFRHALALNSPTVLDAVNRYRRADGELSARDRKSERGIVQHLTRALVRVSPLSRFTAVGYATWSEQPGVPDLGSHELSRRQGTSRIRTDRTLLLNAISGIVTHPAGPAGGQVPQQVRRNPTLRITERGVTFHHWADGRRRTLEAGLTPELRLLLALTAMGQVRTDLLAETLQAVSELDAEQAGTLIANAYAAQFLLPAAAYDEQLDDPFQAARQQLAGHPEAQALITTLEADLTVVGTGSVSDRVAALARIKNAELALNRMTSCPARLQVNEDAMLPLAQVSSRGYQQALDDLTAVTAFHRLYDRHHVLRALLQRAFLDRYGRGASVNLMACADELTAAVYQREAHLKLANAAELGPRDGWLHDLLALRASLNATLAGQISDADPSSDLRLDPAWLARAGAGLTEPFAGPSSYGVLVQPVAGRLVLNGCYNGHGLIGTRFLHADADDPAGAAAAMRLRERIERLYGAPGLRLVEDHGLHEANINHHLPVLEQQCSPDEWLTLRLHHDIATDRLQVLDATGTEVLVFSLGMRWLELQPNALRIAVWLHDSGRVTIDPVSRVHTRLADWEPGTGPTLAYPRIVAGDVVLQRRRWYPGADFPAADDGEEARQLLELTRWRAVHDVPEEVVAKTHFGSPTAETNPADIAAMLKGRRREKPQYLDLGSALMARVLPKLMERRSAGFLEEALPGVRTGWQAVEWAIDVDFPAARP